QRFQIYDGFRVARRGDTGYSASESATGRGGSAESRSGCLANSFSGIFSKRLVELLDLVATGLWPVVRKPTVLRLDSPQGRIYSGTRKLGAYFFVAPLPPAASCWSLCRRARTK